MKKNEKNEKKNINMSLFPRLSTASLWYRRVCYVAIPSWIGHSIYDSRKQVNLLNKYHEDRIYQTLNHQSDVDYHNDESEKHIFQLETMMNGIVKGLLWPFSLLFINDGKKTLSNMPNEDIDKLVMRAYVVNKLRDLPLDHIKGVSEYMSKYKSNNDTPLQIDITMNKQPVNKTFSNQLDEVLQNTIGKN